MVGLLQRTDDQHTTCLSEILAITEVFDEAFEHLMPAAALQPHNTDTVNALM